MHHDKLHSYPVGEADDVRHALEELVPDGGSLDVEPNGVLVLRVTRHMFGHYLHKAFLPFRMLGDLVLCVSSRPANSTLSRPRLLAKHTDSVADRLCGNLEKLAQGLYRKAIIPDRLARNKKPSLPFIECHKERCLLFFEPYCGFILQSCNCLVINYKYTKISPFYLLSKPLKINKINRFFITTTKHHFTLLFIIT